MRAMPIYGLNATRTPPAVRAMLSRAARFRPTRTQRVIMRRMGADYGRLSIYNWVDDTNTQHTISVYPNSWWSYYKIHLPTMRMTRVRPLRR